MYANVVSELVAMYVVRYELAQMHKSKVTRRSEYGELYVRALVETNNTKKLNHTIFVNKEKKHIIKIQ